MSEKEKEIIKKLSEKVPKLDREKQIYVLGIVEGMAIARAGQEEVKNTA